MGMSHISKFYLIADLAPPDFLQFRSYCLLLGNTFNQDKNRNIILILLLLFSFSDITVKKLQALVFGFLPRIFGSI